MKILIASLLIIITALSAKAQLTNCLKTQLPLQYKKNPNTKVFWLDSNIIGFVSEMTIDIDGSPQAYNPQDTGLDALASAGGSAHLSSNVIVFKNNNPYIQKTTDPFPGYYLSQTSLLDKHFADTDYRRYVNADSIPYISLPFNLFKNISLGSIAFIFNKKTNKSAFAIVADKGDNTHIGEGSVALAKALGIKLIFRKTKHQIVGCDAANGSIAYLIFKSSGNGKPLAVTEIQRRANNISTEKAKKYLQCLLHND